MAKRQQRKTSKSAQQKKIRYGVIGLGHISQVAVLPAFRHASKEAELTALISGDPKKLRTLGKKYKVGHLFSYDEFAESLESGAYDALYVALPNHLHADYAELALQKGIHVLCEKPLAVTVEDCRRLIDASRESGAKLMTAYRLHFEEANLKAIRQARSKLGNLRFFNSSSFSFQVRDKDNIRLQGNPGGGPLWDIGIYCINAARYFFPDEPVEVTALAVSRDEERFLEVPEAIAASMKFPGERLASFVVSFGASDSAIYDLVGTKGRLHMESAYEYAFPREMELKIGEKRQKMKFKKVDQFAPELIYFARCIRDNRMPEPSGLEGLADVRIMKAIEESLREGRAVALPSPPASLAEKERPDLSLWMERPPVKEAPKTIEADAPSEE